MTWLILVAVVIVVLALGAFWALVVIKPDHKKTQHGLSLVPTTSAIPRQLPPVGRHYIDQTAEIPIQSMPVPPKHRRSA